MLETLPAQLEVIYAFGRKAIRSANGIKASVQIHLLRLPCGDAY